MYVYKDSEEQPQNDSAKDCNISGKTKSYDSYLKLSISLFRPYYYFDELYV